MIKKKESKIIVISIGYNCEERFLIRNFLSVQKQNLICDCVHIVIDDGSNTDICSNIVTKFPNIIFYKNDMRLGAENLLHINKYIKSPDDVIVLLDLYNWLADPYALQTIDSYHHFGNWVTYGSYISSKSKVRKSEYIECVPDSTLKKKLYRVSQWRPSLPLSFRAHLWQKINIDLLQSINGDFLMLCYDIPLFHLLLDLTPYNRVKLLNEIIAVKNSEYNNNFYEEEFKLNVSNFRTIQGLEEILSSEPIEDNQFILLPIIISQKDIKKNEYKR